MTEEELTEAYLNGDLGLVEFFELALETDLSLDKIEEILREAAFD